MTTTVNHAGDARLHTGVMENTQDPDPEVPERSRGPRRFPAAYKARILAEYRHPRQGRKGGAASPRRPLPLPRLRVAPAA